MSGVTRGKIANLKNESYTGKTVYKGFKRQMKLKKAHSLFQTLDKKKVSL